jgi:hypothetical protein
LKAAVLLDNAQCLTDEQIAEKNGCSVRTVQRILKWRDDEAIARMPDVRAREMQDQLKQNRWWISEMASEHLRSKKPLTRVIETKDDDGNPVHRTEVIERAANPAYATAYRGLAADNRSLLRLDHQAIGDDKDLAEQDLIDDLDEQEKSRIPSQAQPKTEGEASPGVPGVPE